MGERGSVMGRARQRDGRARHVIPTPAFPRRHAPRHLMETVRLRTANANFATHGSVVGHSAVRQLTGVGALETQ